MCQISDILDQVSMRENDIKEVVNYLEEIFPTFKERFESLNHAKIRELIEKLYFTVFRRDQTLFSIR